MPHGTLPRGYSYAPVQATVRCRNIVFQKECISPKSPGSVTLNLVPAFLNQQRACRSTHGRIDR